MMFNRAWTGALLAALMLAACGAEEPVAVQEQRRELLTPQDVVQRKIEIAEARRYLEDDGMPIASGQVLGGFPIPRTYELYRGLEHEWHLRSRAVSAEALARYVEQQVFTAKLERTGIGGFYFDGARLRNDANALLLRIRISPIPGLEAASELHLWQLLPAPPRPSHAQVEAQIEAQRKYAD
jgi:hypothetical protein